MKLLIQTSAMIAAIFLAGCATGVSSPSSYAGQETRRIKALSDTEIQAYLDGKGQGFAKPAELNGYPGPMHVLELAEPLALTPEQKKATESLMSRHKAEVRELGRSYIDAEAKLDALMASRSATRESLRAVIFTAGEIQTHIRSAHLETHLAQRALLNETQLSAYPRLRGYDPDHTHH
jgi:Spy/CpxP family protein refolding chaperone